MLLINFSSSWILENRFMKNESLKFRVSVNQEIIENKSPIYSDDFDIEEVWRIGKKIKEFNDIPKERKIFYLGNDEPKTLLDNYKVISIYKYQKINHKMTNLYYLERK